MPCCAFFRNIFFPAGQQGQTARCRQMSVAEGLIIYIESVWQDRTETYKHTLLPSMLYFVPRSGRLFVTFAGNNGHTYGHQTARRCSMLCLYFRGTCSPGPIHIHTHTGTQLSVKKRAKTDTTQNREY